MATYTIHVHARSSTEFRCRALPGHTCSTIYIDDATIFIESADLRRLASVIDDHLKALDAQPQQVAA
jgi:hypothetical protein